MLSAMRYKDALLENMYADSEGVLRRRHDGYLGRYKQGDEVTPFLATGGYFRLQVPGGIRTSIPFHHAVMIVNGVDIPEGFEADHLDGDRANNKFANLRVADRRLNSCNRRKRSDNSSGVTGIRWSDFHGHFVIRRTVHGIRKATSRKTMEEALKVLAQLTAEDSAYSERHGK